MANKKSNLWLKVKSSLRVWLPWVPFGVLLNDTVSLWVVRDDTMLPIASRGDVALIDRWSGNLRKFRRNEFVMVRTPFSDDKLEMRRIGGLEGEFAPISKASLQEQGNATYSGKMWDREKHELVRVPKGYVYLESENERRWRRRKKRERMQSISRKLDAAEDGESDSDDPLEEPIMATHGEKREQQDASEEKGTEQQMVKTEGKNRLKPSIDESMVVPLACIDGRVSGVFVAPWRWFRSVSKPRLKEAEVLKEIEERYNRDMELEEEMRKLADPSSERDKVRREKVEKHLKG